MNKASVLLLALAFAAGPALAGWDEGAQAFKAGNYNLASTEFSAFVQQSPDSFQGHYMLGLSLDRLNRREEALQHLRKAYDLNPNDIDVKLALAKAYRSVRRFSEVEKLLSTINASGLDAAKQVALYQMRAEARLEANNYSAALKDIEQLRRLRPNDAQIQQLYASTALAAGDRGAAIAALEKSAAQPGASEAVKRSYVQALLMQARENRDKNAKRQGYAKAAQTAAQIATANPSYDNLMLQTSAELGAGLYEQAARTGAKAAAKNSSDWLPHYYVGQAYTSAGRFGDADAPLRQALALAKDGDKSKVWTQLGFVYEKQKDYANAIDAYTRAGNEAAVARVQRNQETAQYNEQVEDENERIRAMEEEARRLEEELRSLEGGGDGRPR